MMKNYIQGFIGALAVVFLASQSSQGGTIIKLDLSDANPDVVYAGGLLSTIDDGNGATTGDQDSNVLFTDFLSFMPSVSGSFSLHSATPVGAATVTAGVLTQNFTGGNFQIYDNANVKLLDVNMANSALVGGPLPVGAFFNIDNGTIVGGTLAPLIVANSVSMSMELSGISGGQLMQDMGVLQPFTADSANSIVGLPVPEPASAILVIIAGLSARAVRVRRRRV
ncbi:MAG TPA: hypothetical protein VHE81_14090 [Lacipirellulaceae bacterium]|nr:hypothetical protein [Lacipirellulaceae bacterium]